MIDYTRTENIYGNSIYFCDHSSRARNRYDSFNNIFTNYSPSHLKKWAVKPSGSGAFSPSMENIVFWISSSEISLINFNFASFGIEDRKSSDKSSIEQLVTLLSLFQTTSKKIKRLGFFGYLSIRSKSISLWINKNLNWISILLCCNHFLEEFGILIPS